LETDRQKKSEWLEQYPAIGAQINTQPQNKETCGRGIKYSHTIIPNGKFTLDRSVQEWSDSGEKNVGGRIHGPHL